MTRSRNIRTLTRHLLELSGVDQAPVPVERIASTVGVEVRGSPAADSLSGFLLRSPGQGALIGVNSREGERRKRFTIAHELGHYLLHGGGELHVDRSDGGFQIRLRSEEARSGANPEEVEANVFAAELLMPAHFLSRDLAAYLDLDFRDETQLETVLQEVAEKYQVSKQALSFRLINLGYVTH